MLMSPLLFERLGWRGVANTTPTILLYGGSAFFVGCIAYQVWLLANGLIWGLCSGLVKCGGCWKCGCAAS